MVGTAPQVLERLRAGIPLGARGLRAFPSSRLVGRIMSEQVRAVVREMSADFDRQRQEHRGMLIATVVERDAALQRIAELEAERDALRASATELWIAERNDLLNRIARMAPVVEAAKAYMAAHFAERTAEVAHAYTRSQRRVEMFNAVRALEAP